MGFSAQANLAFGVVVDGRWNEAWDATTESADLEVSFFGSYEDRSPILHLPHRSYWTSWDGPKEIALPPVHDGEVTRLTSFCEKHGIPFTEGPGWYLFAFLG